MPLSQRLALLLVPVMLLQSRAILAQDEATVTTLAQVLAAEDARNQDAPVLAQAINDPEPVVRRTAALALGRIGGPAGVPLLVPLLEDPDTLVQTTAVFALGLIRDTAAVPALLDRIRDGRDIGPETATETVAALARIGGPAAADWISRVLRGAASPGVGDMLVVLREAAAQAWRLRRLAPSATLVPLLDHGDLLVRDGAWYSLIQLRHAALATRVSAGLASTDPSTRELAARALGPAVADSARMSRGTAAGLVRSGVHDAMPAVRANALRALGALGDSSVVEDVIPRLTDSDVNVRVQSAMTLGALGSRRAVPALEAALLPRERWGLRREALLALARLDRDAFTRAVGPWAVSSQWGDRRTAAQAWAVAAPGGPELLGFLDDPDSRVLAAALQGLSPAAGGRPSAEAIAAARRFAYHGDFVVRVAAAAVLRAAPSAQDVPTLVGMIRASGRDSSADAALAALGALRAIADSAGGSTPLAALLDAFPRASNYLWRGWAEQRWPDLAATWGPAYPLVPDRSLEDYRALVRRFVTNRSPEAYPHVFIETDGRGTLEVELFGPEAPATVANFLRLADSRYFDGSTWHRVVPNFVLQDGDPRGDGEGGPGYAIRDEINRRRYHVAGILGMALGGPDTGGSQWFLTHGPAPHLDGTYTVFGRVVGTRAPLARITQGDVIRTIRR
ncbi:MAG: HEAT repeat domain-containing protein [Gemmatimonadales bacterium]